MYVLMLAAGVQITGCPETIKDTQSAVADKAWNVRIENRERNLERVTVYSGNPSRRRSLLGEFIGKKGMRWTFNGTDVWVECRYSGSSAVLTGHLGEVRSCVFEPPESGTPRPARLMCNK